jgi:hypothetical protein
MAPRRSGAAPALTEATPEEHPQRTVTKATGTSDDRPETAVRPAVASQVFTWATVALVIFAVLAIHDRPVLAALAALAAVVLGMVGEVPS